MKKKIEKESKELTKQEKKKQKKKEKQEGRERKRQERKQYFFVIRELTGRERKRKYSRSYLGVLWSILNPLLSMAAMSAIFSVMFQRSIKNYPMYYLSGTIIWQLFTHATNSAMTALVDNKQLLIRTKLPMQVFILSKVYTAFTNFEYSFVAYLLFLLIFKIYPSTSMAAMIVILPLLLLFSTGLSLFLSTLYVFFGDVQYLYSIFLTLWMFCSAIFYPVESLFGTMKTVVSENPIYCFVASTRECMMNGNFPELGMWIRMLAWSVAVFLAGYLFFRHKKNDIMQRV